jgi:HEPN domain-containing protein
MVKFLNQYTIFLNKARTDFIAAKLLYDGFVAGNQELDLEVICYHLQQCAEKSFKAVLSFKKIQFPKVHDLEVLFNLVTGNGISLPFDQDLLIELSDFATEGRYAVIHDDVMQTDLYFGEVAKLLEFAQEFVSGRV